MNRTIASATSLSAAALLTLIAAPTTAAAQQATYAFDIASQDLGQALKAYGRASGQQVVFDASAVRDKRSPGLRGRYTADEAITRLLAGTGLEASRTATGVLAVQPARSAAAAAAAPEATPVVQELVVTAEKRSGRLLQVPVPVSVVASEALLVTNQSRLQDYYTKIPGLNLVPDQFSGAPSVAVRGISTGYGQNPTVGVTVDDVPYGSSTSLGDGIVAPDIDPSDLSSIEVLRGPQGTLYGASSMGGLLKFVTVEPSTSGFRGRLQAGVSTVENGSELGYSLRGSVNAPLGDSVAVQASAFTRSDPGYIDNPILGLKGVNHGDAWGGRAAALWRPSDQFSVKLSALYQHSSRDGAAVVNVGPGFGDLEQDFLRGSGGYDRRLQAYSATVSASLGPVDLVSVTGYNLTSSRQQVDLTPIFGPFTLAKFGVAGTPEAFHTTHRKFTQELRATAPIGPRIEWLVGGFYTSEKAHNIGDILAVDPATGDVVDSWLHYDAPSTVEEIAAFTDVTIRFTDRFDLQIGGRKSHIVAATQDETEFGPYLTDFLGAPSPFTVVGVKTTGDPFTYLVTPRFRITPDMMAYARFASGYRVGGVNVTPGTPAGFGPDKTYNYDVGVKGSLLGRSLTYDLSVYYIDWRDIQVAVLDANFNGYETNGGRARSQGAELTLTARPASGLSLSAWGALNDAKLTEDFPAAALSQGMKGDRLPFSSRFSGGLDAEQQFPLWGGFDGYVGGALSYVGERIGPFTASRVRQVLPAYAQLDLRAGLRSQAWTLNLYVNNLADKRGVLGGGVGSFYANGFNYIVPRTVGVSLVRSF